MRYFILTLFIAFFPAGVRGTTIVIHKTATDIFVGADSKEIHLTGEPDTLTNKIVELKPSYYFAAAGNVIRVGSNSIFLVLSALTLSRLRRLARPKVRDCVSLQTLVAST